MPSGHNKELLGCHTLRGCVDWNPIRITIKILINVTPFVGVWIETRMLSLARPDPESHTLRGCVDWNFISSHFDIKPWVTPFVGVWIETSRNQLIYVTYVVTPFVGVWIETTWKWQESCGMQRHTLRGCVDWNIFIRRYKSNFYFVTPFVGVWIETPLPVRQLADWNVTPFVGVWIETTSKMCHLKYTPSHTLRGCVDWNFLYIQLSTWRLESHPSWVCGLKLFYYINTLDIKSHTLRGCVDWNSTTFASVISIFSHTLRGCVDWNKESGELYDAYKGHTLRGCMDWNRKQILFSEPTWKSHFCENVPLIVNKLQRQKIWFGIFFKRTQFSIIQQTLVICVQNVSPSATAFVSSGHCIRLLQLSDSTPSAIAFVSFGHRIRLLRAPDSTPSATAFDSFCHRSRLIRLMHSTPSANAAVSFC